MNLTAAIVCTLTMAACIGFDMGTGWVITMGACASVNVWLAAGRLG